MKKYIIAAMMVFLSAPMIVSAEEPELKRVNMTGYCVTGKMANGEETHKGVCAYRRADLMFGLNRGTNVLRSHKKDTCKLKKRRKQKMNEKWLVELTSSTVEEVDRILRMAGSEYVKEYGVETERVESSKIEKAQTMIGTLKFFIEKATGKMSGDEA